MREAVIVSCARTAIGNFDGTLKAFSASDLGSIAAKAAIERAGIDKNIIDEVVIGSVLQGGQGQGPARQVAVKTGLDYSIPAMALNMVCGSGLRAVSLAAQLIAGGDNDVILAGGTESMSNAPYLLSKARFGMKLGHDTILDMIIKDGLTDVYNDYHMGITAENLADKYNISRAEQDEFAAESQNKAEAAIKAGKFADEITPVMIPQKNADPKPFDTDEFPRFGTTTATLAKLKPAFKKDGTVTAGNASGINDGAAMLVIMSAEKANALGLKPLARIIAHASAGVDPSIMGYGVVPACQKALKKAGLERKDIQLAELNEAFAAQAVCVTGELGFDPSIVNVNGGAIALGHPIGASGARILTTLIYELRRREQKLGIASLCIGGGMGTAVIVEALQ